MKFFKIFLILIFLNSTSIDAKQPAPEIHKSEDIHHERFMQELNQLTPRFKNLYQYRFPGSICDANAYASSDTTKMLAQNLFQCYVWWWMIISGENSDIYITSAHKQIKKLLNLNKESQHHMPEYTSRIISIFGLSLESRLYSMRGKKIDAIISFLKSMDHYKYIKENQTYSEAEIFILSLYEYLMTEIHERYPLISTPFISTPFDNSVEALKKMEKLSQSASLFVKTEVNYMLMKIFLDAENTPSKAKKYASRLLEEFPDNLVYRYHYLTILKKTESPLKMQHEQEIIIQSLSKELHGLTQKQRSHFIHLITEKE